MQWSLFSHHTCHIAGAFKCGLFYCRSEIGNLIYPNGREKAKMPPLGGGRLVGTGLFPTFSHVHVVLR